MSKSIDVIAMACQILVWWNYNPWAFCYHFSPKIISKIIFKILLYFDTYFLYYFSATSG